MRWAILLLRWEDKLVLRAEANKMFMQTVQQNVFLILNSVPITLITGPELPSIPVMTHSLDQKVVMTRKAKARKCTCTAEIVGNI